MMSVLKEPQPAKLVIGFLMRDRLLFPDVVSSVENRFGRLDIVSRWLDFNFTDYYREEMGAPLYRRLAAFQGFIGQGALCGIKEKTSGMEKKYSCRGKRAVNIDPGYLVASRFVLATGKDYAHRIYIGKCVYADLTLMYKKGDFQRLEWTYPDYAQRAIKDFLLKVRGKYLLDLKERGKTT